MQDRFKFRHWDKRINEMFYPERNDTFGYYVHNSDVIETMQCTGLKDKNGKLIYEGDIVRFKDNITINGSKTHISTVEFNEQFNTYMYHAECMGLYTVNKAQNEKFDVEVFGNIYENPELLED